MAGLTTAGFVAKSLGEIKEDLESRARVEISPTVKTGPNTVVGGVVAFMGLALSEAWQGMQGVYDSFHPQNARGVALDNIGALRGVTRDPATRAVGVVTVTGDEGTVLEVGDQVVSSQGDVFELVSTVTIPASGTLTDVAIKAEAPGLVTAPADTITTIRTVREGWDTVTNPADLTPGTQSESDADYRVRQQASLAVSGAGTDSALRGRLLALDDVSAAVVISNRTMATDSNGIPAKAFRAVIWPNPATDPEAVVQTIYGAMPSGIESDGTEVYTTTDAQGYEQTVKFSYATPITLHVRVELTTEAGFPADGLDQVKAKVMVLTDALSRSIGEDVIPFKLGCAAGEVEGVESVVVKVEDTDPPTLTTKWVIAIDEIASIIGDNIDVVEV